MNETIRVIQNRRSVRAYQDRPIDRDTVDLIIHRGNGETAIVTLKVRIDTDTELEYYRHLGILAYVLRNKMNT